MLYVFIVSSGCMVKFDMNLAVKKVIELKSEIEKQLHIPVDDQVLLCSGGVELKSENIVGNYFGAGTDTNPIFLFSKYSTETEYTYNLSKTSFDLSIEDDVYNCSNMAPSSNTAAVRATLAQRFAEAAASGRRSCDELVHGQHLQQQGWAAVIANLDDAKEALLKRKHHFEELYEKYLTNRSCYEETLKTFPVDVELLSKVPLLPKLTIGSESIEDDLKESHTLLSWFCSEPLPVLQSLTEKYQRSLDELDHHTLIDLNEQITAVLKKTDNPDIKEVKGIEERLSSLNKQIEDAKKIEKDQQDLASWFSNTQTRISRDPAVLPDLCGTFQKQLLLMLENHKCLRDILDRCTRAKNELSENINYRIKYISRVESEMYNLLVRMAFLEKHVLSVMKQYNNFKQVHLAPQRYFRLLAEVCRRKMFSSGFMKWATELSFQACKLYQKEITIRKSFIEDDSRNMVDNLFPGLDDVPPPFAIECPQPFDEKLPNIVREDLDLLKIHFPDFSYLCEVPVPDPMPHISQAESDSAFSSNIPSSRINVDSADLGGKSQPDKEQCSPCKLSAPSGDCCNLPSEYASLPNEVFSLASSPFEDPLLPNSELDLTFKRTRILSSDTPAHKISSPVHESDAEEFETVDRYGPSVDIKPEVVVRKKSSSSHSFHNASETNRLSKAQSDGDAVSPVLERLKHADSADFQSTEYYIDDSMPSSYTESNATSPLLRGSRMVKSHHILVAELQKQVEDRSSALVGATSSVKNTRSNILKLHAQISALQKLFQELRDNLQNELSDLRDCVKEEFLTQMTEVTQTADAINKAILDMQKLVIAEKEELKQEKHKNELLESNYIRQLEVECHKLNDAETQIANYEQYICQLSSSLEEIKHENQHLKSDVSSKDELIKNMMLEHELELDSLTDQMKQNIQTRENKISETIEALSLANSTIQSLELSKRQLEDDLQKHINEKEQISLVLVQKETEFSERLKDLKQLQDVIRRLQEGKGDEELQYLKLQLEKQKNEMTEMKKVMEQNKAKELTELEEELKVLHKNEIESLRSRYKLTVAPLHSVTSSTVERLSPVAFENANIEAAENTKKCVEEHRRKWEEEKEVCIRKILEEQKEVLQRAVADAVKQEALKYDAQIANIVQEHEGSIERMKSRQTAETQVSFNEAINSVTKQKDSAIESLRSRVSFLEGNLISIKFFMDKLADTDQSAEAALSQSDTGATSYQKMSDSKMLQNLKSEIEPYLQILHQGDSSSSSVEEKDFFKKLKMKGKSRISSCIDCTYKISILSCDVGDLIVLCYEEKHENFVVFHAGPFVHFLHTDSLQPLGLKIPAGPSERWALGVVTFKEFCVARKPSNRYKINLGAKFYRVKVKPWDKEKSISNYQLYRSSQLVTQSPDKDSSKGMSASSI